MSKFAKITCFCTCLLGLVAGAAEGPAGFHKTVAPFFKKYCIDCHGPEKSKGKITLHTLIDSDLVDGRGLEHWEAILDVLYDGEMPPEEESQPPAAERAAVAKWIETSLRTYVTKASQQAPATTARRMTNFEYQNTMRDLLGVDLEYAKHLPEDPEKPYHFNNTAEFMLLGPDQYDRYLEIARKALAGIIVDLQKAGSETDGEDHPS